MGLSGALFTGVSGLNANGSGLSVIGDNIANTNTVGFKGSRAAFGDVLSTAMGGGSSIQIGRGVNMQAVTTMFTQGTLETTSNPLDLAIEGDGFFIVKNESGAQYYTRAGQFKLNKDGNIINPEGMLLQGYLEQAGGVLGTINVSSLNSPASVTSTIDISANLTSGTPTKLLDGSKLEKFYVDDTNKTIKWDQTPIVTGTNDAIRINNSGVGATIALTQATYSASGLATELAARLNAAVGPGIAVAYHPDTHSFTITNNSAASLEINWSNALTTNEGLFGFNSTDDITIPAGGSFSSNLTTGSTIVQNTIALTSTTTNPNDATTPYNGRIYTGAELATELASKLNTALGSGADITVAYNTTNNTFSITNTAGNEPAFGINWNSVDTTAEQLFGFKTNGAVIDSYSNVADGGSVGSSQTGVGFNPDKATDTSDFSTSITVYDSLGNSHLVTIYFRKTQESTLIKNTANGATVTGNTWDWYAVVPGSDSKSGVNSVAAHGRLSFNTSGYLVKDEQGLDNYFDFTGGVEQGQAISFGYGTSLSEGGSGIDGTTQFGTPNSVLFQNQNGNTAGSLQSLLVDQGGAMTGVFTNGKTMKVADVSLARFIAATELTKTGKNLFSESSNSGVPIIGTAGTSGRGNILASSLEGSNVDLAEEFVRMIAAQRGFQANTKVISATDQLLQELGNLKQ